MVLASRPVVSESRLAARPVGAQSSAAHLLGAQNQQDGIDQRGLAHARPAGDDQHPAGQRLLQAPPSGWGQVPCPSSPGTRRRPCRNQSADSSTPRRHSFRIRPAMPSSARFSAGRKTRSSPSIVSRASSPAASVRCNAVSMSCSSTSRSLPASSFSNSDRQGAVALAGGLQQHVIQPGAGPDEGIVPGCRPSARSGRRS